MTSIQADPALDALVSARTIAVVGLDNRTYRTAYRIAAYLQRAGYRVIPVWFQEEAEEVLGEKAYARLQDVPERIDLADVFVRSELTNRVIDDAIAAGVGCIWLQQGIVNPAGLARARAAGIVATEDRCTMVEHRQSQRHP